MKRAFTLAEVLITLAIIGVVAALTIPSVVANTQQQEFKTGLKKAVSVLNSAITMNMAIDGETPYENANLFGYLMRHMAVMESTTNLSYKFLVRFGNNPGTGMVNNAAFYTTDGMRFEFNTTGYNNAKPLYENNSIRPCGASMIGSISGGGKDVICGGCGSYGLANNTDNTTKPPCIIVVDVNGDRKPNPANINCKQMGFEGEDANSYECMNTYKTSDPRGKKLTDLFSVMITDKQAIPFGVAAQKAMYEAQK